MISTGKRVGVDAGSVLIKLIELSKSGDSVSLVNWSFMPARSAPNAPLEATAKAQAAAIDAAIKKCGCKCRDIVVGVPGSGAFIRNIKLPPVPSSKIDQIVRYEIQQTIPFPMENIALDYQVLEPDESSEVEVIMVAMKGEMAENFIRDVEKANVKVGIIDSVPLALYNSYRFNGYSKKEECTAIIELGGSSSNILIELGGELRYCRSVSIGSNHVTEAIAKELSIPAAQAERIKIQYGLVFPETQEGVNPDQIRVSNAIAGVLDRLMGEVKLTIGYFRSLTGATAISRVVLAGGGALLKNIRPFLGDRLGVQAELLNPFKKIEVPQNMAAVKKMAPLFATAVGLALRNSQECCQLKISLVPPKLKEARTRRSKLVYNTGSVIAIIGIVGLILWRAIPEATDRAATIAALDKEIARYAKFEPELDALKEQKSLLASEYNLYWEYSGSGVDPIVPMAVLAQSLKDEAWVKELSVDKGNIVTVEGSVKSATKVDGLKRLSALRADLEKYCSNVRVKAQTETKDGVDFTLELSGLPTLSKFLEQKQEEEKAVVSEKSEQEQQGA